MKMRHLLLITLSMLVGVGTACVAEAARPAPSRSTSAPTVSFEAGDRPGNFFTCSNTANSKSIGCVPASIGGAKQRSLAVIAPGETVGFPTYSGEASTIHTALSLIYPTGAKNMPFKTAIDVRDPAKRGVAKVTLTTPGLYVFICDIHVYMFAAVIVDDPLTKVNGGLGLDLGKQISLVNGITVPTYSDLALRLLRTFFIATDPGNWKDYTRNQWAPTYPAVPVIVYADPNGDPIPVDGATLVNVLSAYDKKDGKVIDPSAQLKKPSINALGEIWVDTQFELTAGKSKPGTATAIDGKSWGLTKKVALPAHNMNHPHNMWTDKNQEVIYQTQWFDERLAVFKRVDGSFIRELNAGPAPSHVMTRADNDQVHVAQNGDNYVREFEALVPAPGSIYSSNQKIRDINMGGADSGIHKATHPHGHWMSASGKVMVTPNENVGSSTIYEFIGLNQGTIRSMPSTGAVPIATGMMPDSSKYYVANLLDNSITVIDPNSGQKVHADIDLLKIGTNYFPLDVANQGFTNGVLPVGALPIQTPVSPDGTNMVTANTLTATITVVDTKSDTVVAMLPCDPGCHGVQYGAKDMTGLDPTKNGQYYAYVASKFSNVLIVVDPDPNGDGNPNDAAIVGRVLLGTKGVATTDVPTPDTVIGNPGMGGQGVLAVPVVYNGWVQQWVQNCTTADCLTWKGSGPGGLTDKQKAPAPVQ